MRMKKIGLAVLFAFAFCFAAAMPASAQVACNGCVSNPGYMGWGGAYGSYGGYGAYGSYPGCALVNKTRVVIWNDTQVPIVVYHDDKKIATLKPKERVGKSVRGMGLLADGCNLVNELTIGIDPQCEGCKLTFRDVSIRNLPAKQSLTLIIQGNKESGFSFQEPD